jgi:hypothetical protein
VGWESYGNIWIFVLDITGAFKFLFPKIGEIPSTKETAFLPTVYTVNHVPYGYISLVCAWQFHKFLFFKNGEIPAPPRHPTKALNVTKNSKTGA